MDCKTSISRSSFSFLNILSVLKHLSKLIANMALSWLIAQMCNILVESTDTTNSFQSNTLFLVNVYNIKINSPISIIKRTEGSRSRWDDHSVELLLLLLLRRFFFFFFFLSGFLYSCFLSPNFFVLFLSLWVRSSSFSLSVDLAWCLVISRLLWLKHCVKVACRNRLLAFALGAVTDPKAFRLTLLIVISRWSSSRAFLKKCKQTNQKSKQRAFKVSLTSSANRRLSWLQMLLLACLCLGHVHSSFPFALNLNIFEEIEIASSSNRHLTFLYS